MADPRSSVEQIAREFIAYHTGAGLKARTGSHLGCSNCGGLAHSSTCFVKRFEDALLAESNATPAVEGALKALRKIVSDNIWQSNVPGTEDICSCKVCGHEEHPPECPIGQLDALLTEIAAPQEETPNGCVCPDRDVRDVCGECGGVRRPLGLSGSVETEIEISAQNWLRQAAGRREQTGPELDAEIIIRDLLAALAVSRPARAGE